MGDNEEVKPEDIKIKEDVNEDSKLKEVEDKISEEVKDTVKKLIDLAGIDSTISEPIISEVASTITTAAVEKSKAMFETLGLKMISESSLSDDQKKLASKIYDLLKDTVHKFIADHSLNNTVKITMMVGRLIKELENVNIDGHTVSGNDKKVVAIQVGRILIKEVTPDDKNETEILMVYDLIAEPILEAMIDVSRVVNVNVKEMAAECFPGILKIFKRSNAAKVSM